LASWSLPNDRICPPPDVARPRRRKEFADTALFDVKGAAGNEPDAVQRRDRHRADEIKAAQHHDIVHASIDNDAIAAADDDASLDVGAVDRHRLGDGHGAEAAGIDAVDLAAGGGLRNRSGEGLAGRRAAARIGVVADAGYPGAGRLRLCGRTESGQH
jgi:hypothetical protein